jgi:SAM-dependent methyltransferase
MSFLPPSAASSRAMGVRYSLAPSAPHPLTPSASLDSWSPEAMANRAYWDRVAASVEPGRYPLWRLQSDLANRRLVDSWLPPDRSKGVLKTDLFDEIAGEGLYEHLAARFATVTGIDISPSVVAAVRERHPRLEARVADVRSLPFADASFGAVVSNSTLDHLERRQEVLAAIGELARVVEPGGTLLITLDNPANPLIRLREALPERAADALRGVPYGSGWTCGSEELAELLGHAGLELAGITAIVHFPRALAARADRLARRRSSRARWRRLFLASERLASLPTRTLTGHFVAVRARRPDVASRGISVPAVAAPKAAGVVRREPPRALRLADRAMRPVARRLDADKMALLGIRNTMRLAKRYNTLLYGRYQRFRERLWRERFAELAAGNGGLSNGSRVRLEDGFAIDESGTLPHLEEVLRAGDEVIVERAGKAPVDDRYRAFFRHMIDVDDLDRWPQFLDFVTSSDLIATVSAYLGFIPALSKTLPTGVRVVESGKHLDSLAHLPPRDSQVFHIDPYDHPMIYVIVLLRDCTPEMGPFIFLPASVSERAAKRLDYWSRGRPYRLSDEEIYSAVDPSERIELTYPRGTVLFIDTSRCFHYGSRNADEPRFQVMYGLTSPCRSDFSETYMSLFDYKIRPGDSPLRRLVLDRRILGA